MTAPDWLERKACRPEHAGLFFGDEQAMAAALALCRSCEARQPCRADAERHGDIVDGHTTHGHVVGGCGPKAVVKGERPKFRCQREGCGQWFTGHQGANMYCSPECSAAARKAYRSRQRRKAS